MVNSNLAINKKNNPEPLTENLCQLMKAKGINEAELARRTSIPQPTLHKILTGKTEDPRASTLKALSDFFNTSIDELLSTSIRTNQPSSQPTQIVPVISWKDCIHCHPFLNSLESVNWNNWVTCEQIGKLSFSLISKPSMEPRFPRGTTLIIDPEVSPEDGDLVIVHYPNTQEATIREIVVDGPIKLLLPIGPNSAQTKLDKSIKLIGVLVKSAFTYHPSL